MSDFYVSDADARPEPRSLGERTDRILEMMANPSVLGAMPSPEQRYDAEIGRLRHVDPPIRNLGDEMVMLGASLAFPAARALPYAIRMGSQGAASIRALSSQAEQAADAIVQSFRNRLGRPPTVRELAEALGPLRHVAQAGNSDREGDGDPANTGGYDPGSFPGNARWTVDGSGEVALESPYSVSIPRAFDMTGANWSPLDILRQVVTEAQDKLGETNDRIRSRDGRTFQSYTKDRLDADRVYAGRTSGNKAPERNVERRDRDGYPSAGYKDAELDRSSNRYSAIRGREQQLIDHFRSLNMSDNANNGIWPLNLLRSYYMRNSDAEFGPLPPRTRGSE